jgi:predicted lipoprotein with Yx(FWY)xxD motif
MTRTLSRQRTQPAHLILRVAGAGLLAATGAIHLDLYLTGYRTIPTIGWLFLLQVIAAFALAVAVLLSGRRLAAAAGAGFALATLAGYLLSIWVGLFGFTEVRTTAGIVAGIIEVAAFAVLALLTVAPATGQHGQHGQAGPLDQLVDRVVSAIPAAGAMIAGVSVVALVLLGVAAGTSGSSSTVATGNSLKVAQIGGASVLANAKGFTLYWFAPDTSTKSVCNGSCAAYWPPVKGPVTAGPGIPGKLGTIKRADGTTQATYNGHPLYTYVGDSAPGQARGNKLNLNGGLWYEVTTSG